MYTTATVGTNEGWTFAGRSHTSELPITTSADNEQTKLHAPKPPPPSDKLRLPAPTP